MIKMFYIKNRDIFMRNKIVLVVFVLNLIPISAMSNEIKERTYDYPWTEKA